MEPNLREDDLRVNFSEHLRSIQFSPLLPTCQQMNLLCFSIDRKDEAETFHGCMRITTLDDACRAKRGKQNPTSKISLPLSFLSVFLDPWWFHHKVHPCTINEVLITARAYNSCHCKTQLTKSVSPTTGLIFPRSPETTLLSLDVVTFIQKRHGAN